MKDNSELVSKYLPHLISYLRTFQQKVRMVAVVHEVAGAQAFNDGWWKGDLYFDEDKAFYKALGGGNLQWRSPVRLIMPTGIKTLTKSFLYVSWGKNWCDALLC